MTPWRHNAKYRDKYVLLKEGAYSLHAHKLFGKRHGACVEKSVLKNFFTYPALWAIAGLIMLLQLLTETGAIDLSYQRQAILGDMPWRLLTGQFVHSNTTHMVMNLAALILLAGLIPEDNRNRLLPVVIGVAILTGALLMLMEPQLEHYVGLSGVLHGLSVVIAIWLWRAHTTIGPALLLLILIKIALEQSQVLDNSNTEALIGVRVATEAHLWGAISGIFLVAILALMQRLGMNTRIFKAKVQSNKRQD